MDAEKKCCTGHKWIKLAAVLCLTAIIIVAIVRDRIVNQYNWQVQVTGTGEITYEPDTANLNIGVTINNEKSASKAISDMTSSTKKIIEAVLKLGVPAEKLQTTNFNLNPHYVYTDNKSEVTGYDAEQTLLIKIEGVDQNKELLGKVIEAASAVGANKVQGIEFTSSKIEQIKQEARIAALKDARSKATGISEAAGVRLTKIVGWWENMVYPTMDYGKGGMGMGGSPETIVVPSGQQKMKVEMNVSYLIKPGHFRAEPKGDIK